MPPRIWTSGFDLNPKTPSAFSQHSPTSAAPLQDLTVDDLSKPGLIFQIGVEPIRIDVITAIDGVEFPDAWAQRVSARFADQKAAVLCREHLLTNKRAAGREQDLLDVKWLEKTSREKP